MVGNATFTTVTSRTIINWPTQRTTSAIQRRVPIDEPGAAVVSAFVLAVSDMGAFRWRKRLMKGEPPTGTPYSPRPTSGRDDGAPENDARRLPREPARRRR